MHVKTLTLWFCIIMRLILGVVIDKHYDRLVLITINGGGKSVFNEGYCS